MIWESCTRNQNRLCHLTDEALRGIILCEDCQVFSHCLTKVLAESVGQSQTEEGLEESEMSMSDNTHKYGYYPSEIWRHWRAVCATSCVVISYVGMLS